MEALFGFIAGWMLTWPMLIGLLLVGIIFEANDAHGWALFTGLIAAATAYFYFSLPLVTVVVGAVGYLAVGFVWSFWRYKRHATQVVAQNLTMSDGTKLRALSDLHPTRMLGKITTWILIWPFSMVENVAGDLITVLQLAISKFFRGIYHRIYNDAVAQLGTPK